eukprot:428280-Rhodomonas_salina.1
MEEDSKERTAGDAVILSGLMTPSLQRRAAHMQHVTCQHRHREWMPAAATRTDAAPGHSWMGSYLRRKTTTVENCPCAADNALAPSLFPALCGLGVCGHARSAGR